MLNIFKKNGNTGKSKEVVCKYCNTTFIDAEHLEKHTKLAHAKGR